MSEFIEFIEFLVNETVSTDRPASASESAAEGSGQSGRRPLRVLLVGDRADVRETIKNLHQRGFAPVAEWSKPLPWAAAEETIQEQLLTIPAGSVISICTRYLT